MLRVAFLDQSGKVAGGAERTLAIFLKHRPPDIEPLIILFEAGSFHDELENAGLDVRIAPVSAALASAKRERLPLLGLLSVPLAAVRVARLLRKERIDVLYTNSMKAHFVGAVAARLASVPCVMHFHDIVEGNALRALRWIARFGSKRRVACSKAVADWVGLPLTEAIYGPVELETYDNLLTREEARASLGLPDQVPVIAIIGRINRWKGHERFLRIAARVLAEKRATFLIVGSPLLRDAEFLDELKALVETNRLQDSVRFVAWLDDVRTVYASIDLNANCSFREPFGRAVAEAAAAGVATILFDDSGAAETVVSGSTGVVIAAGDERAFADAILRLLDRGLPFFDAETIRRQARQFDAERISQQMAMVMRAAVVP